MNLEAPNDLPGGLKSLSNTSVELFLRCQEKWRKTYIENAYEPPWSGMILGRAVHAAETQSYASQIVTGVPHTIEQVLDDFSMTLENEEGKEAAISWDEGESAGTIKDQGIKTLRAYHATIPYIMRPTKVETKFKIRLHPEHRWTVNGFIDVIASMDDGLTQTPEAPHDLKTAKKKMPQADLDKSLQGSIYTYATMQESETTRDFIVHELKPNESRVVATPRTREDGEHAMELIAAVARQIERNIQTGDWQGASAWAWWCSPAKCGYFNQCPKVPHGR